MDKHRLQQYISHAVIERKFLLSAVREGMHYDKLNALWAESTKLTIEKSNHYKAEKI